MSVLSIKNLSFHYPETKALQNISFDIPTNKIVALVGPNGAGKSTLFKCITGEYQPLAGQIHFSELDPNSGPTEIANYFGYLSDFFGLYSELTVEQSLRYFCMARNIDPQKIDQRIKDIAKLLDLDNKLKSLVSDLSRGMRQRLAIGQVIVHYPKILFLDEPASGLDPQARINLGHLLKKLRDQREMTIIVSSHILAELDQYAQDLIILEQGELVEYRSLDAAQRDNLKSILVKAKNRENLIQYFQNSNFNFLEKEDGLIFELEDTSLDKSSLLKDLINNGIDVFEFIELRKNLQDEYLSILKSRQQE